MAQREDIAELVALVDRLERLLERSALSELEIEFEGTTVILRTPSAVGSPGPVVPADEDRDPPLDGAYPLVEEPEQVIRSHAVVAPLTGVFYRAPSPGAEPYVREGGQVNAGQVIGLIEAMKLFNEIKSDVTGTIRHVAVGDGSLVKAREALIEVEPA